MLLVVYKSENVWLMMEIARCWNGGPRGMQNEMTANYWRKVQENLDS